MANDLITQKQDLTQLSWDIPRNLPVSAGPFMKSCSQADGHKLYYKLPSFRGAIDGFGNECVNELIADRLFTILGIEHLHCKLVHADVLIDKIPFETYLCESENFLQPQESKLSFDCFYELEHEEKETPLNFCIRQGWENFIYKMFVGDFLIMNRSRDGSNIEVIRNRENKTLKPAPLFGHSLSLLFYCKTEKQIDEYDIMEDKQANNYVGFRSVKNNLRLIPKHNFPKLNFLKETDREFIMDGLDTVVSPKLLEKSWEMIWKRWCYYENICRA